MYDTFQYSGSAFVSISFPLFFFLSFFLSFSLSFFFFNAQYRIIARPLKRTSPPRLVSHFNLFSNLSRKGSRFLYGPTTERTSNSIIDQIFLCVYIKYIYIYIYIYTHDKLGDLVLGRKKLILVELRLIEMMNKIIFFFFCKKLAVTRESRFQRTYRHRRQP